MSKRSKISKESKRSEKIKKVLKKDPKISENILSYKIYSRSDINQIDLMSESHYNVQKPWVKCNCSLSWHTANIFYAFRAQAHPATSIAEFISTYRSSVHHKQTTERKWTGEKRFIINSGHFALGMSINFWPPFHKNKLFLSQ